jgi:hypothetical protein
VHGSLRWQASAERQVSTVQEMALNTNMQTVRRFFPRCAS